MAGVLLGGRGSWPASNGLHTRKGRRRRDEVAWARNSSYSSSRVQVPVWKSETSTLLTQSGVLELSESDVLARGLLTDSTIPNFCLCEGR